MVTHITIQDRAMVEFVAVYSLQITSLITLQYSLLLMAGYEPSRAQSLALDNNQIWIDDAHIELRRIGFIRS